MQLFPAIDLRGGQVVRLTQGDYDRMTVYGQDPCAQARSFVAAGAKNLHVVDLDGAKDGTLSNYDTIAALAKQGGLYIEVGGGIRTEERIEKYLSLGVGRCILGSVAVTDFAFTARMLQKYGDKIAVGVDAKDGYVAIHGWKEISAEPGVAFCKRLAQAGCTAIIYTDIACDGAMQGTNLSLYRQLAAEVPGVAFTASGGISSETELLELQVPPVSILSLVENAVKYGVVLDRELVITIKGSFLRMEDSKLADLKICDNGQGFPSEIIEQLNKGIQPTDSGEHIGIWNVIQRFHILYGKRFAINFWNHNGANIELMIQLERRET